MVYNLQGRVVAELVDEFKGIGNYEVVWNATEYSSGVYFIRLVSGKHVETRKILLIK